MEVKNPATFQQRGSFRVATSLGHPLGRFTHQLRLRPLDAFKNSSPFIYKGLSNQVGVRPLCSISFYYACRGFGEVSRRAPQPFSGYALVWVLIAYIFDLHGESILLI